MKRKTMGFRHKIVNPKPVTICHKRPFTTLENALKDGKETEDVVINNHERLLLIDILACISVLLKTKKVHFETDDGKDHNLSYADFCEKIARRFANLRSTIEEQ